MTPSSRDATMGQTMEQTEVLPMRAEARLGRAPLVALVSLIGAGLAAWGAVVAVRAASDVALVVAAAIAVAWAAAASTVAIRRSGDATGPLAAIGSVVAGIAVLAEGSIHAQAHGAHAPIGLDAAQFIRPVAIALIPAVGLHLLMVIPRGELASTARRVTTLASYVVCGAIGGALIASKPDLPRLPLAAIGILAAVIGGSAMAARYPRASATERKQMQWIGWGFTVAFGASIAMLMLDALVSWPPHTPAALLGSTVVIPLALAFSTSPRLNAAIDKILSATISLAGLASVVAVVYVAIVLGLGRVPTEKERTLLVLSMIAAAIAALLYIPTRNRLQQVATRMIYGERHAPDEVIRSFGSRLSRAIPLDELMLQMAESLRKTLALDVAEVWTGTGGRIERTVSDPERPTATVVLEPSEQQVVARAGISGPAWIKVWLPKLLVAEDEQVRVAPITHSGELLGLIVVRRHPDRGIFDEEEERIVVELARQVGLALHNVRLDSALQASLDELRKQADALQASRARIVAAADAERRRIERNLHDGAQQYLVALAVKVGLAKSMMANDPAATTEILGELSTDVQETLDELRRLAHGIYPPLLADRGLFEALRSAGERSPVNVSVEANGLGRYSQEVEAAVYFCCLEALQNIGKYAGEGVHATVKVWEQQGGLLFEVSDDGAGFDVRSGKVGAGFTNMSDRVGAIGGNLRVTSAVGQGTTIAGTIPLTS